MRAAIAKMWTDGVKGEAIAAEIGRCRNTVLYHVRAMGLPLRPPGLPKTKLSREEYEAHRAAGLFIREIAAIHCVHPTTISHMAKNQGWRP